MEETAIRSFADVLADRAASSVVLRAIDQKLITGTVKCLPVVDGPVGCTGVHCPNKRNYCKEKVCLKRVQARLKSVKVDNTSIGREIDGHIADIEGLLVEISVYCRTDSLNYPAMEESCSALKLASAETIEPGSCECLACQLIFEQKNAKVLKQKLKAAEARHTALDEYRRAHDKEALARTNDGYMKGGKYFTPVGTAKAKGVKALRPTLQLQNSYDVQNLTTNSMEERPLIGSGKRDRKKHA